MVIVPCVLLSTLSADSTCKLHNGKSQYHETVVSYEENRIILFSKTELPETIGMAKLEIVADGTTEPVY